MERFYCEACGAVFSDDPKQPVCRECGNCEPFALAQVQSFADLLQAAKDASQMLHALAAVANQMPPKYFAMVQSAMPQGYGDLDAAIAKAGA